MRYTVLTNPREPNLSVFEEDFDEVAARFSDIVRNKSWAPLPGGVIDTYVPSSAEYSPMTLQANDFRGYRVDSGSYLAAEKSLIGAALSAVEGRGLDTDDYTLCPSVTFGLFIILLALRRKGIRTIVAELPAYFASIEQATALDFQTFLWPTISSEHYIMSPDDMRFVREHIRGPIVLLVTQPRYGMGFLRSKEYFESLRLELREGDVLIVDEAADQTVPARLGSADHAGDVQLLRVRGLTKGLGLNSARIAAIFHSAEWRESFGELVDYAGGTLDSASVRVMTALSAVPKKYASLLRAAQAYVSTQKAILSGLLHGLPISLSPVESGYIGTAHVRLECRTDEFAVARERFLQICVDEKMPVVLGSSMYFPYDKHTEIFRINYFSTPENIEFSGTVIGKVLSRFIEQSPG